MRIEVTQCAGVAPAAPIYAEFDELGGSIGRAEGNTLTLPDDKRHISRTQAVIAFGASGYRLRDLGSATPTLVNGKAVGNGNEVALSGGDEIRIGDYVLMVSGIAAAAAHPEDPFADLLPPGRNPTTPRPRNAPPPVQRDPLPDPFASGLSAAPVAPPSGAVIPQDFDPFGEPMAPRPPEAVQPLAEPVIGAAPAQSIDDLFGLKSGENWDPLAGADPLASTPALGLSADPFAAPAPPQAPVQRDDAPILSGAFRLPQRRTAAPAAPEPPAPAPAPEANPPASPALPDDAFLSWNETPAAQPGGIIKSVVLSAPRRAAEPEPAQPASAETAAHPPAHAAPPERRRPAPAAPAPHADTRGAEALLEAFLAGAGVPDLEVPGGMTPDLMRLVGEVLRESTRGTLELLLARALTKREVRAQATVIVARENNPLKFSPNVEAALSHLLAPQGKGYMAPADALRDAYNDLRSHQFGFMAGMRAALEGVLARFDPAQLESRIAQKGGVMASLVPSSRRARLWELYEQLYRDISREAEDDFQALFGREFLRAYEAQIEKLEREDAANAR